MPYKLPSVLILKADLFYQKELVESPPAFEGDIKIRVFITPILRLLGRGSSPTVNCQLSTVNCQLSTVNCQLSTVNCQLSTVYKSS
ncbi:MAG: hypothetical protein EAZ39_06405 [Oscillatoriales cyanobacterium]|nr:MAG: hypothetical protein EAZ88_16010 [Oscillatoriales cyanobacterium]TAG00118.1 MAG: hypothetical protein EAZ45_16135 [Oscillatoriales cyanobacterium]TAG20759.1 MAG: hypothetical protein EAZ39_06405 [Oscillatoriales cyanobacterium]TAG34036.1 MAG: hypothetical protein EAZ33_28450 [Oscillatoriales cyanobacterium]TAG54846.1 MAG: hypothetical protein EAZ28_23960 [Oscillatoriales cyanobacterium]